MRRLVLLVLLLAFPPAAAADTPPEPQEKPPSTDESEVPKADEPAEPRFKAKTFPAVDLDPERRVWVGEPINLSLRDADLVEVLRSFAKMTDANVIIDPKVQGKVTVELKGVPWDQALHVILKSHGLGMEVTGNVWVMKPVGRLRFQ